MNVYVIQSKHRIMIKVGVSVKYVMIGILAMMIICGILVHVIVSVIRHVELMKFRNSKLFL